MSSLPTSSPTVVFFGATGGVTNAALVHTLKAGYRAIALVRTPEKLRTQLASQGLDETLLNDPAHLTIVAGNALDVDAVKGTLAAATTPASGAGSASGAGLGATAPWYIVTGLGGSPSLTFNWRHPGHIATLDNPTICESAARTLIKALRELYTEKPQLKDNKPLLTFVSTTGISRGPEDVPFAMRFLYHQMLAVPHVDKKKMEGLFRADAENANEADRVFRNVVGIRPTLLSGGVAYTDAVGLDAVKSGVEARPALGYSIKRADVGHWIFENLIDQKKRNASWEGEMVTLTS